MWTETELARVFDYLMAYHAVGLPDHRQGVQAPTLPFRIEEAAAVAHQQLEAAIVNRNADVVEAGLWLARVGDMPQETYFALACRLVVEDWHHQHENLIGELQDAEDPRAVPYLRQAIDLKQRLDYLDFDDYGSYYKKCLWALQAIGNEEAIAIIRECATSDIEVLREQAIYRLSKISG